MFVLKSCAEHMEEKSGILLENSEGYQSSGAEQCAEHHGYER
jgi:hypothetical protein